ncbi:hypothetical protein MVES1_000574 [Malassezia vespertilionis]|uniref:ditrans,polycis-polyprenyl diphosphate synthase [(2E,6E)-farnesyldiphosphate specific] n=1 Tax=Malassezia vespertilionis TaxID=2020962 RepID=A0A2N1JGW9_9BASI|nr:uncharacterized protein MVES1_000574 [Malassezia vespertilionis]PKI85785.1 hypothetical protein MVES_000531 [Malassezia vespertilionis]WFD05246.1 hypothetical protein MVES1_000574 [Malassezia vespertilionis]
MAYRTLRDVAAALHCARDGGKLSLKIWQLAKPRHLAVLFQLHAPEGGPAALQHHRELQSKMRSADALRDIVLLLQWCAIAGIRELTIFDTGGILRDAIVHGNVYTEWPLVDGDDKLSACYSTVQVHAGGIDPPAPKTLKLRLPIDQLAMHASSFPPKHILFTRLNLLSAADDKQVALNVLNKARPAPLMPAALQAQILASATLSCLPDMLLVCGSDSETLILHGFPYWALRTVEMRCISSWRWLGRMTPTHFYDTLVQYTDAEQRFGT